MARKFAIAAQNVALELKGHVHKHLLDRGFEVVDLITPEEQDVISFTIVAEKMARAIQSGEYELGFVFCGSGMGVSQVVNKFRGIRGALIETSFTAKQCRIINDSNVLCMGQHVVTPAQANEIADIFVDTAFLSDGTAPGSVRYDRLMDGKKFLDTIGEK